MNAVEWGMLLLLSLLWGGSYLFNAVAVGEIPPLTVAFFRVAIAAAALLAVCRLQGVALPRPEFGAFVVMGVLNNVVPMSLILWGQTRIGGGLASILNATTPMFTVLAAHVLTEDEKLTAAKFAGVACGVTGVAVLVGPKALAGLSGPALAQLACLAAALSYAFASIFGRRFRARGVPPLVTAAGQLAASSAVLLPLALLSSAFAYVLYFRILATAGATNLVLVTLLIPASVADLTFDPVLRQALHQMSNPKPH